MKILLVVDQSLVTDEAKILNLKSQYNGDVHQQLIERLEENAVTLPSDYFDKVVLTGPVGKAGDAIYNCLAPGGEVEGHDDPNLVLSGFVKTPSSWKKLKPEAAVTVLRKPTNKKNLFKRLPDVSALDMGSELIDEDDLVMDAAPAIKFPAKCDPGPGRKRRKACKDCTCGLKEVEEQEIAKQETKRVLFSSSDMAEVDFTVPGKAVGGCGSCALGDAFRCDGCPYLGLPPFKPGEVVSVEQFGDDF